MAEKVVCLRCGCGVVVFPWGECRCDECGLEWMSQRTEVPVQMSYVSGRHLNPDAGFRFVPEGCLAVFGETWAW